MRDPGATERKRRQRERRREGVACVVGVAITFPMLDALTEAGFLKAWSEGDRRAIGAAVAAACEDWAAARDAEGVGDFATVAALVRSVAAAVPLSEAKDDAECVRIICAELEHYTRPLVEEAVKCRKKIRSFKGG